MKTLIIGNSHVGALIKAYKDEPDANDLEFLAVDGNTLLQNLDINEHCELVSERERIAEAIAEQGLKDVSLNSFDFIFIYGCQLRAAGSGVHWIHKISCPRRNYSAQVCHAADTDFVHDTTHYQFLERAANWNLNSSVNVISIPSPLPNELAPFCEDMAPVNPDDVTTLNAFIKTEIESLGFGYMDTPDSLLTDNGYTTKAIYKATWIHDTAHLNTPGGVEVLAAIRAYVQAASLQRKAS